MTCRVCGCTDDDCRGCIERTGEPCSWWHEYSEHPDGPICSACAIETGIVLHGNGAPELLGLLDVSDLVEEGERVVITRRHSITSGDVVRVNGVRR